MTSQSAQLEVLLGATWTNVPLLLEPNGSTVTRGLDPYSTSWPRPSTFTTRINNDSLSYDPSLPTSLLFGRASRYAPVRFSTGGGWALWGEASEWKPDRTPEHVSGAARGLAWVDLTGSGMLDRIGKWAEPLASPMARTISARTTCIGHWPLEDDRQATRATALIGAPGRIVNVSFGEADCPDGAKQAVQVGATSLLSGRFNNASSTAGWQMAFSMKLPALPPSATYVPMISWTTANRLTWVWSVNNANYNVSVFDSTGASVYAGAIAWNPGAEPTNWITFRLKASQVGGNVQLEPAWYNQGGTVWGATDTFAGSVSVPRSWMINGTSDGTLFSHVFAVTGLTDNLLSTIATAVFDGYRGEKAGDRANRVAGENAIPIFFLGSTTDTQPMGPQPIATALDVLKDCRATDDSRLDDERFSLGITWRVRRALYNQTPALTLTYPSQVAQPFKKLIDTAPVRNVITIANRDGSAFTKALLAGPNSTQAPPLGIGQVPQQVDVNVANEDQLDDLASYWLARLAGAVPPVRFESVTVDLLANPGLAAAAKAVREGDRIQVTGYDYDPIDLLVTGIQESIGPGALWSITFQVEPYDLYRIGVYDDGVWRWDAATSTIPAGATSTATSIVTNCTNPNDVWTTAAGSLPFDAYVATNAGPAVQGPGAGEVVRVTAVTAAGAGPTYAQTLTITRSINGVVRTIPTGAAFSVYNYRRWGL